MCLTWKKLLALIMVAFLLIGNCNIPGSAGIAHASAAGVETLTSDKAAVTAGNSTKEKTTAPAADDTKEKAGGSAVDDTKEKAGGSVVDDTKEKAGGSVVDRMKEKAAVAEEKNTTEDKNTANEQKNENKNSQGDNIQTNGSDGNQQDYKENGPQVDDLENDDKEVQAEEEISDNLSTEESTGPMISLLSVNGPHDIDMPELTSHYFKLQKESKKVASASASQMKVVDHVKAAAKYITMEMENGNAYSFTPHMTSNTSITVGGGSGGTVSLDTVKKSNYARFGHIYNSAQKGNIQTHAFDLSKCSSNPYALYTNVGTWYDTSQRKTFSVDMKLEVTGYLYPSAKIQQQMSHQYTAPYIGFTNNLIGIMCMGTDSVKTRMTFYYHGSNDTISNLHGVIQFCDIDAQQGVDFGEGFEKIIMFRTEGSHLQYNSSGILESSKGYISSRSGEDFSSADARTTALGIFSGSSLICQWTLAKCDHLDTGGTSKYAVSSGYGVPADTSQKDAVSYYYSNSTGFLGVYADLGLISLPPEVQKNQYSGSVDAKQSTVKQGEMSLKDRNQRMTFVLNASAASPSDLDTAEYTDFSFSDTLEALFEVDDTSIKVYTESSLLDEKDSYKDVTELYEISKKTESDHKTSIQVRAKKSALKSDSFYGKTYYVHIPVRIRTEEELSTYGLSLNDWYQQDQKLSDQVGSKQDYRGMVAVGNEAKLYTASNQGTSNTLTSNTTGTKIPMRILLRKFGDSSDTPVAGVTFALYGGSPKNDEKEKKPLMTVVTDQDGYACFETEKGTLYDSAYGDGPYYIREISIPELYKDVWSPSISQVWNLVISSLKDVELYEEKEVLHELIAKKGAAWQDHILWNTPKENPEASVKVYKKSKDTGEMLRGAEFVLYEWSEKKAAYVEKMTLTEGIDTKGSIYYYNAVPFVNSMDNLGRYQVLEKKAPQGCILSDEVWNFTMGEEVKENVKTFENALQKVKLKIHKMGDDGTSLEGVTFTVKAAEDIYAPWGIVAESKEDDSNHENSDSTKKESFLIKKNTIMDVITTDADGIAVSSKDHELYVGKYIIEETEGAVDYIKSTDGKTIELEYSEDIKDEVTEYSTTIQNEKMYPSMAIAKLADRTKDESGQKSVLDERSGRYQDKSIVGKYQASDSVNYAITVTNTGNVPLYQLRVEEVMSDELSKVFKESSTYFVIPSGNKLVSRAGDEIIASIDKEKDVLILDHLNCSDAVEIHFRGEIKDEVDNATALKNTVNLSAQYESKQRDDDATKQSENDESKQEVDEKSQRKAVPTEKLVDSEGNSLVSDSDFIDIYGEPILSIAKLADRTTGVTYENGKYVGTRKTGDYKAGETVRFSIKISNTGNAKAYDLKIVEHPSEKLLNYVTIRGFQLTQGQTLKTSASRNLTVKSVSGNEIILDELAAGDMVEVFYECVVKKDILTVSNLKNIVKVEGKDKDGNRIPDKNPMEDEEKINLKKESQPIIKTVKEIYSKTHPKTGDSTRMGAELGIAVLALTGILLGIRKKRQIGR